MDVWFTERETQWLSCVTKVSGSKHNIILIEMLYMLCFWQLHLGETVVFFHFLCHLTFYGSLPCSNTFSTEWSMKCPHEIRDTPVEICSACTLEIMSCGRRARWPCRHKLKASSSSLSSQSCCIRPQQDQRGHDQTPLECPQYVCGEGGVVKWSL